MTFSIEKRMDEMDVARMLSDPRVSEAINDTLIELARAEEIHPSWPIDPIHQVCVMAEEAGEAVKSALDMVYKGRSETPLRTELVQTAAMCIRCLINLEGEK